MLYWLGEWLEASFGPARLFQSYLFLGSLGTAVAALGTWAILPRIWDRLPRDVGRAFAVDADKSVGKATSAGIFFVPFFGLVAILFVPSTPFVFETVACTMLASIVGYLDDRHGWSEYKLGAIDAALGLLGASIVCQLDTFVVWLPIVSQPIQISPWIFVPVGAGVIWLSINATNCTDGVDGLSATLLALGLAFLGAILYAVVGHSAVAKYLLVPHYEAGATWALLAFVMLGCLAGYLWHNAHPSRVLMGDSGSRPVGLLLGLLVLATGNPFVIFVVAFVVLANGATGLLKVALLRFLKIPIFSTVRYPLHDHVRHAHGWSNTQVLVRFAVLQAVAMPILLVLLIKIR